MEDCINYKSLSLSEWVVNALENTCDYLRIPFDYSFFSKMDINTGNIEHAGQWALEISDAMGANEYINPPGGFGIFEEKEFLKRNIELRFIKSKLTPYIQRSGSFVPGMSIIDIMMWNDKDSISEMLNDFEILSYAALKSIDHE